VHASLVVILTFATIWGRPGHSQVSVSTDTTTASILRAATRHVDTTLGAGKRYLSPIVLVYSSRGSSGPLERWDEVDLLMLQLTLKATVGLSPASELFASDSSYQVMIRFGRPTLVSDGSYDVIVGFVGRRGVEVRSLSVRKAGTEWAVVNDRWIGGT
jgi:hypothetical protein